jgi:hypothetical protein
MEEEEGYAEEEGKEKKKNILARGLSLVLVVTCSKQNSPFLSTIS